MSHINPSRVRAARVVVLAGMLAVPAAASAVPPGEQQSNPDTTSSAIRTTTGVDCEHPSEHPATGTTAEQRVSNPCEERAPGPPASTARGGGPRATNASSSSSTGSSASSSRAASRRRSGAAATDATRPSGRQPGASSNPARGTPPARGGGPRSVPEDCGPNGVGPDGHCVAPDLAPDSPQQQWDRDPRLPPANQQNAPGPAAPQARAPEPGGTQ